MGNCQAAEAATVVIQHPGSNGKVERIYWSVSANDVMSSNLGHYVALVLESPVQISGPPVKHLKLLRPDDTLHIGHVYRLITFEDVLKEFAAKKSVKLGKLLKESVGVSAEKKKLDAGGSKQDNTHSIKIEQLGNHRGSAISSSSSRSIGRHRSSGGGGQWKPALQSIAELGT